VLQAVRRLRPARVLAHLLGLAVSRERAQAPLRVADLGGQLVLGVVLRGRVGRFACLLAWSVALLLSWWLNG
jgi:hypothetical protein